MARVSVSAALLLLLLGGCAATGVDNIAEKEVAALSEALVSRHDQRHKEYNNAIEAIRDEAARAEAGGANANDLLPRVYRMAEVKGRLSTIESFWKLPEWMTVDDWNRTETARIATEKAGLENDILTDYAKLKPLLESNATVEAVRPILVPMAERTFRLYELRGNELEMDLLAHEWAAHMADYSGAYRRADEREVAEERAQQQSLLLLLGGLQQLNYNLQEQDRYNQQQRYQQEQQFYQQQLLHELSKPIRCTTFGATTTCN